MTHIIDHAQRSLALLARCEAEMDVHAEALKAARELRYALEYDRARDLPWLLPHWKFLADALAGRSSTLAIIDALQAEHKAERHKARVGAHASGGLIDPDRVWWLNGAINAELAKLVTAEEAA